MANQDGNDHGSRHAVMAIWSEAPRYETAIPLPPTAFVPGQPRSGRADIVRWVQTYSDGTSSRFFRYGLDLYHFGYLWEAHEAWEVLWQPLPRADLGAILYRVLILNAAAQLKRREGRPRGVRRLSRGSHERCLELLTRHPIGILLNLDVAVVAQELQRHYGSLWEDTGGILCDPPPRFKLIV